MKEERFEVIYTEGSTLGSGGIQKILVDRQTGVHYLFMQVGYSGGLTPLLDRDGRPVVTSSTN